MICIIHRETAVDRVKRLETWKLGVVSPQKYSHSVLGPVHLPAPAFNAFLAMHMQRPLSLLMLSSFFLSPSSSPNNNNNKKKGSSFSYTPKVSVYSNLTIYSKDPFLIGKNFLQIRFCHTYGVSVCSISHTPLFLSL